MSATEIATEQEHSARNTTGRLAEIPVDIIAASNLNPRKHIAQQGLQELAESERTHGILEPLVVRPITPAGALGKETPIIEIRNGRPAYDYKYELIAGERRWRAAKLAGLATVPAVIRYDVADDGQMLQLMLVENLQRADLDPIEQAEGYKRLAEMGVTQKEIGEKVHKSQGAVSNAMRLLKLPPDVRLLIRKGKDDGGLEAAHGVALAKFDDFPEVASKLAELAVQNKYTSHQLEKPWGTYGSPGSELASIGVVRWLGRASFNARERCQGACPHNAFRSAGEHQWGYCLKPDCFDEKEKAYAAAKQADLLKLKQAAAERGPDKPKLQNLPWDSYHRLDSADRPSGCQDDCPKAGEAIDNGDKSVMICSDLACWQKLKAATTRAENKAGRELVKTLLADLERKIDALVAIGPREMAVIGQGAIGNEWRLRSYIHQACKRQGRTGLWGKLDGGYAAKAYRCEVLEAVGPLVTAKLLVEAVCRMELIERYQERRTDDSSTADWYLQGEPQSTVQPGALAAVVEADLPAPRAWADTILEEPERNVCGLSARYAIPHAKGTAFCCEYHWGNVLLLLEGAGEPQPLAPEQAGKIQCGHVYAGEPIEDSAEASNG